MRPPGLTIVHEGRGGYIEIDTHRYVIEHIEGGKFSIHFPSGNRSRHRDRHLQLLTQLCEDAPATWRIERRDRKRHT